MKEQKTTGSGFPNTHFVQNLADGKEVERVALQHCP